MLSGFLRNAVRISQESLSVLRKNAVRNGQESLSVLGKIMHLTGKEPYSYRIGNIKAFLSYLTFCDFLTKEKEYEKVHNSIIEKVGYSMTKFRTAELIMYSSGAKENTKL